MPERNGFIPCDQSFFENFRIHPLTCKRIPGYYGTRRNELPCWFSGKNKHSSRQLIIDNLVMELLLSSDCEVIWPGLVAVDATQVR